jgi:hypothetical protein
MLVKPMLAVDEPSQEADCSIKSPLLSDLLGAYTEEGYYQVLDTMPAYNQLIEYFSRLHCKLFLPGCHESLLTLKLDELDTETKLNRALIKHIGLKKQSKAALTLILLWDLPNYLEPELLQALIQYLLPHCKENVMLHAYIHTREQMPTQPGIYKIHSGDKSAVVSKEQTKGQSCSSPMYFQETLQKLMSPFLVQRSILLSGGMQEYLLQRR